jgi:hypothetical protein
MWTLMLVIFVASGASTGGVGATTPFWIFPTKQNAELLQKL